jgi:HKD family nuclease
MRELKQTTLTENKEIFQELKNQIKGAETQIKVASAWFTDPELFSLLIDKQQSGVEVKVIISDQKDNYKLPFGDLVNVGGKVLKIKNVGYGMMHQKFCIIDNKTLIHGSYNWTVNARKNNHESVIITNHEKTVDDMKDLFKRLEQGQASSGVIKKGFFQRLFRKKNTDLKKVDEPGFTIGDNKFDNLISVKSDNDYKKVLENMIESEVNGFDKEHMKEYGFDRGRMNNGDHGVITNSLDAMYSKFLDDLSVSEDRLSSMKTRVEMVRQKALSNAEKINLNNCSSIERIYSQKLNERINVLENLTASLEMKQIEIEKIEEKKEEKKEQIEGLNDKLNNLKRTFIPSKPKAYELVLFGFLGVGLLTYLFLFYSSAGYIMMHSTHDAIMAELNGVMINTPDVYDSKALGKAYIKGFGSIAVICLFFLIPLTLAVIMIYKGAGSRKGGAWFASLGGIFLCDVFIACKVSKSIFDVKYLMGDVDGEWKTLDLIYDSNFYLVFMFGMGGLLAFEFVGNKVKFILDQKHGDSAKKEFDNESDYILSSIDLRKTDINNLMEEITVLKSEIRQQKSDVRTEERAVDVIPAEKEREIKMIEIDSQRKTSEIEGSCDLVIARLESGRLPFSVDNLKERICVFFEGWNDYVYSQYADNVAKEKSEEAAIQKEIWIAQKSQIININKVA